MTQNWESEYIFNIYFMKLMNVINIDSWWRYKLPDDMDYMEVIMIISSGVASDHLSIKTITLCL